MGVHFNHAALSVSMNAMRRAGKVAGGGDDKDPSGNLIWAIVALMAASLLVTFIFLVCASL